MGLYLPIYALLESTDTELDLSRLSLSFFTFDSSFDFLLIFKGTLMTWVLSFIYGKLNLAIGIGVVKRPELLLFANGLYSFWLGDSPCYDAFDSQKSLCIEILMIALGFFALFAPRIGVWISVSLGGSDNSPPWCEAADATANMAVSLLWLLLIALWLCVWSLALIAA